MSLIGKALEIFERRWGRPKGKETCPCGAPLIFKKEPFHFCVFYIMEWRWKMVSLLTAVVSLSFA
ncbi:hypothetical protein BCV53_19390 (plasmid) [Parageobacillus thermoglucosidasius]|uniref:Uncharacterized protein n=1 Tax=Parageobacillus thermoglucosidasius TaxID=1426 RepID=A0AAN1D8F9_PARTM|nr:hypothetical protein BCV53_19390 [Parageobacillus thermoglucosidasius]APM82999.1 hypothetical protein BCV54_19410 [Parageobacillus thermoglucosidasius]KJX67436.1 hypothetical protein WH82_17760 [Parageobacillus thermoglucosidasius]RDE18621.1 hypothetical protein DV712_20040 [Parageobacillus thermoglucosidasius]